MNSQLPQPDEVSRENSQALVEIIRSQIQQNNGWISFLQYMQAVLYTPVYGYYSGSQEKIGRQGDFITAPELTSLFGQTLANALVPLLRETAGNIYEFGAGTGVLALDIIKSLPEQCWTFYYIVEVSAQLRQRQRQYIDQHLPEHLAKKVVHLDSLPEIFDGVIVGNEVLDAMPCERICWHSADNIEQVGVALDRNGQFVFQNRPLQKPALLANACKLPIASFPYTSELHLVQQAFISTLAKRLVRGGVIFIDYGFDEAQFYSPHRTNGTLIGHYRHHTIHDPFFYPGLCDLTCHVNFTVMAEAALDAGLTLAGFTSQAQFLLNLGITDRLTQVGAPHEAAYIKEATACQTLLGLHEMGEQFKVIGFARGIDADNWQGFTEGDICYRL